MGTNRTALLVIDGKEYEFNPGETILVVAIRHGIDIPTLCYMKGLTPTGACRMCLVEVEGARTLLAACATPGAPNMVVRTETSRVLESRKLNLELLVSSGNHDCLSQNQETKCSANGACRLQELALRYQVKGERFTPTDPLYPVETVNPFIVRDFSRCILCGRCVQACNEVQVNNAISFGYRGTASKIVAVGDRNLRNSDCVFCGECLQACPVGALVTREAYEEGGSIQEEGKRIRTTCSYCGVGCQLLLHVRDKKVVKVTGVENVGPNFGSLCVKGRFGYHFIQDSGRLQKPLIREKGRFREASWDEALHLVAERFSEIKSKYGPDAIGVLSSARITNEENYLTQKFARAVIGTNNIDHCARL